MASFWGSMGASSSSSSSAYMPGLASGSADGATATPAHGDTGERAATEVPVSLPRVHWRMRRPKQALRHRAEVEVAASRKRKLGEVGLMCSRVASRPKAQPKPKETLRTGRPSGAKELTLFEQSMFVETALEEKSIIWNDSLLRYTISSSASSSVSVSGQPAAQPLRKVERWTNKRHTERWAEFARDADMQRIFGHDPLKTCSRMPKVWTGKGPGRPAFEDLYKEQIGWVMTELLRLHDLARKSITNDSPDWETVYRTWCSLCSEWNRTHPTKILLGDRADGTFSMTYVMEISKKYCLATSKHWSTEPKRVEKEDAEAFREELDDKMKKFNVDPRALQSYDEYNDFYDLPRRKIVVRLEPPVQGQPAHGKAAPAQGRAAPRRPTRRSEKGSGLHQRHVKRSSNARRTVSAAVVYGPFHKGPIMLMVDQCAKETADLIQSDLGLGKRGSLLVLVQNGTGNCYGSSHVEDVIPRVLVAGARRARTSLCLPDDAKVMTLQDRAPGHCGDKCSVTGEQDLNKRRFEAYDKNHLVSHLYSYNGTPEQCVNDHVHQMLKSQTHEMVRKLMGDVKDLTRMPDAVSAARGGPLVTSKGYSVL